MAPPPPPPPPPAAAAAAEPVHVVVRVRPEPIKPSSSSKKASPDDQQLCVFAEGPTRVSIVSTNKDHLSRTVASASRAAAPSTHRSRRREAGSSKETVHARSFALDRVFGPFASQREVYEEAAWPLIRSVVDG